MKTAEKWVAESLAGQHSDRTEDDCVRLIQADAIRYCRGILLHARTKYIDKAAIIVALAVMMNKAKHLEKK